MILLAISWREQVK